MSSTPTTRHATLTLTLTCTLTLPLTLTPALCPPLPPQVLPLRAQVIHPELTVQPESIKFGAVHVLAPKPARVVLTNPTGERCFRGNGGVCMCLCVYLTNPTGQRC